MLHVKDEEEPTDHMLLHFDKARITRQLIFLIGIVSKKQSPIRVTILTRHRSFIGKKQNKLQRLLHWDYFRKFGMRPNGVISKYGINKLCAQNLFHVYFFLDWVRMCRHEVSMSIKNSIH